MHLTPVPGDDLRLSGGDPRLPGYVPGRTLRSSPQAPAGSRLVAVERIVGRGRAAYDRAVEGLFSWEMHRRAGFRVDAPGRAAAGIDVRLRPTVGPAALLRRRYPCAVVGTVEGTRHRGFVYAALPGHLESGEESFMLVHDTTDGTVRARVVAISSPAAALARWTGPLARGEQDRATVRYLGALRGLATGR